MEPESSLPHSQVFATCPYPEPNPSSPHNPSHFLKIHLNIILSGLDLLKNTKLSVYVRKWDWDTV
jgi:hypothetical protein